MAKIRSITAREILDSRGNPTLETSVRLEDGSAALAGVPSGASVGTLEAVELRDADPRRFAGMGVLHALNNITTIIAPQLIGKDASNQRAVDMLLLNLDTTKTKQRLGANTILSVSVAVACAQALSQKKPLYQYINELIKSLGLVVEPKVPPPTFNIINGGQHGAGNLDFQEFHVLPASARAYREALRMGVEIYHQLKNVLIEKGATYSVGDEGGYAANLYTNLDACQTIIEAIKKTPYKFGVDVFFGLDIAANHFFSNGKYTIKDKPLPLNRDEFITYLGELNNQYKLIYLEDPLSEDDWEGWKKLTALLGKGTMIVGDDLLVTNPERLKSAIDSHAANSILIKPNQIGTLSETINVIKLAKNAGFKTIVSHRSGETNDTYIADFAVGIAADYVKFGAPARGERVAKYNRLLQIESELKQKQ
ncbi:phosphopyruvate hydratase [Candidatus Gottesmanbacteria bacterium]|nr:phosphopyruvate hydratase [Candidatus Gottesmanbacteria bacterium]